MSDLPMLEIGYRKLSELRDAAFPGNPKDHDLDTTGASMAKFGYMEPVILDGRTGKLIAGHGRTETLERARGAGEGPPAGIDVDGDGDWLVPTVLGWSSRSDTDAKAALVALNRTTELGGWDNQALTAILTELAELPDGLEGVGYNADDLADLVAAFEGPASLDELEEVYGQPAEEDMWPVIRVRVSPDTFARWAALMDLSLRDSEQDKVSEIVEWAMTGAQADVAV